MMMYFFFVFVEFVVEYLIGGVVVGDLLIDFVYKLLVCFVFCGGECVVFME